MRALVLAIVPVVLATLACGGMGGGATGTTDALLDLRFTTWDCYEGGYYEWLEFKTDGRCVGSSDGWGCTYTQTGNDFTVVWTGSDGELETWSGVIVDPAGLAMGGTSLNAGTTNDFRCTRDL